MYPRENVAQPGTYVTHTGTKMLSYSRKTAEGLENIGARVSDEGGAGSNQGPFPAEPSFAPCKGAKCHLNI